MKTHSLNTDQIPDIEYQIKYQILNTRMHEADAQALAGWEVA
jgi:hypothetical protein